MKNETRVGKFTVGGQPTAEELRSGAFSTVVNIRRPEEDGNVTADLLAGSTTAYVATPWTIDTVTAADIAKIREAVAATDGPVLIH